MNWTQNEPPTPTDRFKADKNDPIRILAYFDEMGLKFDKKFDKYDQKVIYYALCELSRTATQQIATLQQRIAELEAWKESAISVMPDYQEIGRLLGVKIGQSVHDKIIPGIKALQAQRRKDVEDVLTKENELQKSCWVTIKGLRHFDADRYRRELKEYLTKFDQTKTEGV